jgi:FkbM family methyltransferase
MTAKLKAKIKKLLFTISGRFNHLKQQVTVLKKWYGNSYGGFFVCSPLLDQTSVVYSFGIGEDISFDRDIIKNHHCNVFGFDPTPKSIKWVQAQHDIPQSFKFYQYGIGVKSGVTNFFLPKVSEHVSGSIINQVNVDDKNSVEVEIKSLEDIISQLGHQRISVLKMDIEGAEYDVIESILKCQVAIDQILIEFHERFFADGKNRTSNVITMMTNHGYKIFGISDSFDEVSFIKADLIP